VNAEAEKMSWRPATAFFDAITLGCAGHRFVGESRNSSERPARSCCRAVPSFWRDRRCWVSPPY